MNAIKYRILKGLSQQQRSVAAAERGLTMIEVVAAIVILTIALASITAPLALSAATRIQNRRIQQASVLAQQEINRVDALFLRSEGISADDETGLLPPINAPGTSLDATPAPTTVVAERLQMASTNNALLVDIDDDGRDDFFMQLIGSAPVRLTAGNVQQVGVFQMAVRVYDAVALQNLGDLETQPVNVGLINSIVDARTMPLVVLRTELAQSDGGLTLQDYRIFICTNDAATDGCTP